MNEALLREYKAVGSKLLLLDYDGVLAPIVSRPEQAKPTREILRIIQKISLQKKAKVVIISGRDHKTLEDWLGMLPIDMSAEHGHFYKESGVWRPAHSMDMTWARDVEAVMRQLVTAHPGSHIEEKQASLVWHYREVQEQVDAVAAQEQIEQATSGRAIVMAGKCVIDVRAPGADKGYAALHWYRQQTWDFVLSIGDDVTDEAMFTTLPKSAWTIKVGSGHTAARYRLNSQADVGMLLSRLAESV